MKMNNFFNNIYNRIIIIENSFDDKNLKYILLYLINLIVINRLLIIIYKCLLKINYK